MPASLSDSFCNENIWPYFALICGNGVRSPDLRNSFTVLPEKDDGVIGMVKSFVYKEQQDRDISST